MKHLATKFGIALVLAWFVAPAESKPAEWCENEWLANSGQYVNKEQPDFQGLLAYWQGKSGECAGNVAYEARQAVIHLYLDDQVKARSILAAVKNKESPYRRLVEFAELMADALALADGPEVTDAQTTAFSGRAREFAAKYPDFPEGLGFVGGILTTLGNHAAALPLLQKADSLGDARMSRAGIYRNATISLAATGQYAKAYEAGGAALSGNKGVMADPQFMYAVIRTQAELGMLEEAQTSAQILITKMPVARSDPEFLALIDYIRTNFKRPAAGSSPSSP